MLRNLSTTSGHQDLVIYWMSGVRQRAKKKNKDSLLGFGLSNWMN